ncbi:response regulator transcription factor [Microbacterium sp. cx-55]|uniref:response regulator transcription factor n=1 Tax=unclassified Microbacterium TaxID=2609290 RepID=UPI001CBB4709|nr:MULTISPECIES: response regulator transcription factor [unclassified Microbacterium]MCC4909169.1 response regulator transcription factor [Microbacterium sp. cx-59]UGB34783.1 response regulator transcription factor [Microbacterium sp. cx-55]
MAVILVVEDDSDVAGLIEHRLSASGHTVTVAGDGIEGLAAAHEIRPDVVILDWMMPRRNGVEVCEDLRAEIAFDGVKIIMLTARAQAADIERAYTAGVDDYMTKPFSPRELLARVEALVG